MKVSQISKQPTFQAGKIIYFSQIPEETWENPLLCGGKPRKYSFEAKKVKNFLEKYKDNTEYVIFSRYKELTFHGNNIDKYATPSKLILSNGSDVYIRKEGESFSNSNKFPFTKSPEISKVENDIIKNTNWNSKTIIEKAKEIFAKAGFKFSSDKNRNTIIGELLTNSQSGEFKERTILEISTENFKTCFSLHSSNPKQKEEYITKYKKLLNQLTTELKNKDIKVELEKIESRTANFLSHGEYDIIPQITGKQKLKTSDYIAEALEQAKKNNDLVIIYNGGSLDKEINPFRYMKDYTNKNSWDFIRKNFDILKEEPKALIKLLKEKPDLYKDIITELNSLPLVILDTENVPEGKGINKKYFKTNSENIPNGIKNAIQNFAEKNPEFKKNLPTSMLIPIKKIIGATLTALCLIGGYVYYKNGEKNENK